MNYYQFNIGDYRKDTGHLSLLEHGIYRMLLDSYYSNEGPLDADDAKLMRTHCIRTADEEKAYRNVIADFFKLDDGVYRNDGCDKVLAKIFAKSESARLSAEKRWAKKSKASKPSAKPENANAMRTHSDGNANGMLPTTHNPLPNTQNNTHGSSAVADKPPAKPDYPAEFESIWQAYPKREGANPKNKAFSAYKARLKEGVSVLAMAAGTSRYFRYCQAKGSLNTEYVMQAQRFLGTEKAFENDWIITETGHAAHQPGYARQSKSDHDDERMRKFLAENSVTGGDGEDLADAPGVETGYFPGRQH